ncbi:M23 family metallopeptidase [Staphylococcus nepalensis]|uniref:M23 family metallopeptidase n=1 Tax=Staphylococcus nepalensis TaxID=214473 RepID=UPI000E6A362E|nr:M23 family metallopeptidase [Staphylococcus nepalensis]RIO43921.1 M23 family metallopeptidase [Staphylococcus nepalensis]
MTQINAQMILAKIENNEIDWLYEHFSDYFQEVSSYDELKKLLKSYNAIRYKNKLFKHIQLNYREEYIWFDEKMATGISVTLNKYNEIIGFVLTPIKNIKGIKKSKCYYTIPVQNAWFVYAGGENELLNHHYPYKNQRYALDLVLTKANRSYHGNPNLCESYYSYNQVIVAPADGVVVKIIDGIPDATPGENNMKHPEGNYVIMKHANNEYSMIAHIKPHSFKVNVGDCVTRGQFIARIGNSGNAMEPHVHFQIMNQCNTQFAKTYKIKLINGTSPEKGDIVSYTDDNMILKNKFNFATKFKKLSSNMIHIFKN